jgi:hypothetical protein
LFFVLVIPAFSQEKTNLEQGSKIKIDSLYREDQFYFSFGLTTLQNKPPGLNQDKFSSSFSVGFLRDFPINKSRTIAIAPGFGLAYSNFNNNLQVSGSAQLPIYTVLKSGTNFDKNKFNQLLFEVPLEFRWRSSTYESYKFWRIYTGFKMGYLLYNRSIYDDTNSTIIIQNSRMFRTLQYGTYVSIGYSSLNIFAYYGLNSLFYATENSEKISQMSSLKIGVMFYIL